MANHSKVIVRLTNGDVDTWPIQKNLYTRFDYENSSLEFSEAEDGIPIIGWYDLNYVVSYTVKRCECEE